MYDFSTRRLVLVISEGAEFIILDLRSSDPESQDSHCEEVKTFPHSTGCTLLNSHIVRVRRSI